MSDETEFEKVIRDGKVAVLFSPGFGAGWSTWNSEHASFALFDSGLIALAERGAGVEEVDSYIEGKIGKEAYFYSGGWGDIRIEWLPAGTPFTVEEYDGSESLRTSADLYHVA